MHLGAIPHTLSRHLCIDFVNSRFDDYRGSGRVIDRLELEEWRRWFVARCGLGEAPPMTVPDRHELVEFRSHLRRCLEGGTSAVVRRVEVINAYLGRSARWPVVSADADGFALTTCWTEPGWPAVISVVAESYAHLLAAGELERVHVCANPDCTYMFFDESPASSRRWCDVAVCGNLMRVRRHRGTRPLPT